MRLSRSRLSRRFGLLTTLTLVLAAAPAPAPAATTADTWSVPTSAWITIRGHGFGHGHGMSQYGAEGAARQGLTYRQIAEFYYPGTAWGTARGRVTVLITADTTDDLEVLARSRLSVRDTASGDRYALPANGASRWRIAVAGNGATRVSFRTDHWHGWKALAGDGEFYAGGQPIALVTPAGTRQYRGRLRLATPRPGSAARDTVNDLELDSYVKGVVPLEIPASWSAEAVRAQSVAARTYAAYERAHPHGAHYQLCDTSSCQVYGGYGAEVAASNAAVDATRGAILTSGGAPAFTQFASSSGGWTSAGSVPYLPAREDPYDAWAGNPVHSWSLRVDDRALERRWPAIGNLRKIVVNRRDGHGEWGGRVASLTLVGGRGRTTVSGDTFRSVLGLRSTWVTFRFTAR